MFITNADGIDHSVFLHFNTQEELVVSLFRHGDGRVGQQQFKYTLRKASLPVQSFSALADCRWAHSAKTKGDILWKIDDSIHATSEHASIAVRGNSADSISKTKVIPVVTVRPAPPKASVKTAELANKKPFKSLSTGGISVLAGLDLQTGGSLATLRIRSPLSPSPYDQVPLSAAV